MTGARLRSAAEPELASGPRAPGSALRRSRPPCRLGGPAAHRGGHLAASARLGAPGPALRGLRSAGFCVTELPAPARQGLLWLSADFADPEPGSR